jgi:hypothetical protein
MIVYKFTYKFIGRTRGAIGIFYPITATVEAEQEADAILRLYDNYEHIQQRRLIKKTKLSPYRFSFTAGGIRHSWIRFYHDMETAFEDSKRVALRENDDAHGFLIESDQNDPSIRRSWGL